MTAVNEAVEQGSRQEQACEILNITARTLQRWQKKTYLGDQRRGPKTSPKSKLTLEERQTIIAISSSKEFVDLSPRQIVPRLADRGEFVASESSFYRILAEEKQLSHRGRSMPKQINRPRSFEAKKSNQLYSWDITYLRSSVRGQFFYLYLFLDLFSRKIIGWEVHEQESMDLSSQLLKKICFKEKIEPGQLKLHSDNGSPMKGATMLATMQWLGIVPSFNRPSVSNDNPFSESLFKTLKYYPQYPEQPFVNLEAARTWVASFVSWYNTKHFHSAINFVTPDSKHKGEDVEILKRRDELYAAAKSKNPSRWSGKTRNWSSVTCVKLNTLKTEKIEVKKDELKLSS